MGLEMIPINDFISPIIVLACLCVGYVIKNIIPNEKVNNWIPLIVCVLGILLNIWNCGGVDLLVIVTGAISGLASTGFYEAFKGFIEALTAPKKAKEENAG